MYKTTSSWLITKPKRPSFTAFFSKKFIWWGYLSILLTTDVKSKKKLLSQNNDVIFHYFEQI